MMIMNFGVAVILIIIIVFIIILLPHGYSNMSGEIKKITPKNDKYIFFKVKCALILYFLKFYFVFFTSKSQQVLIKIY